jgi:hypothetical protein
MIKMTWKLLAGAVALVLSNATMAQDAPPKPPGEAPGRLAVLSDEVLAEDALPDPLPAVPDVGVGGGVLQTLPKPRDLPASLFTSPPPPTRDVLHVDAPFFTRDPLLDFSPAAPPGWFAGAEVQIVKPHLIPGLRNVVEPGKFISNAPFSGPAKENQHTVALPSAPLDWTASPRVFLGYRFPSGFGEFMVAYRHLGTEGSGVVQGPNGPAVLNSRFAFDILDLDYNSRELALGPRWDMKWTFGLRSLFLFYDSRLNEPFAQAAAGNDVFQARNYNNLFGFGPHAALELNRRLGDSRWSLSARGDVAATFDWTHQGFATASTTLGPNGRPLVGETRAFGHQASPMINGRAGLTWQPSPSSGMRFFLGYQYEVIWDLVRVSQGNGSSFPVPSLGQFWDQGLVFQATFRY